MLTTLAKSGRALLLAAGALALAAGLCRPVGGDARPDDNNGQDYADVVRYISAGWKSLSRSMGDCNSLVDPKSTEKPVLYLPADFIEPHDTGLLPTKCQVEIEHLPAAIHRLGELDTSKIHAGLLYLPNPYVVPGGMFNEMYGWDSYFIIRGLLREGDVAMARGMVENFFFEIEHYGGVLNANRTYYLTRSQPPFLSSMVRSVYEAEKAAGHTSKTWLGHAYSDAVADYEFWTRGPHLAGTTGLSRYYDLGEGPVPDLGPDTDSYYRGVASHFLLHPDEAGSVLVGGEPSQRELQAGPVYSVLLCNRSGQSPVAATSAPGCSTVEEVHLSRDFYKGDRSMRESGFDVSFRFGPFGAGTHHFAPVDLNSLLYKTELDLAWFCGELGRESEAASWEAKAHARQAKMDQYFWNPSRGLYFDYDFEKGQQSSYDFATTFYPLWVGAASPEQAKAVAGHFQMFDQPGGIVTSRQTTGAQWDYPYGWAPLELIAVEGLRHAGDLNDADLASQQFLSLVAASFRHDGTIREKYNVVTRSSATNISVGYAQNVIGFGWTNGVFLELLHWAASQNGEHRSSRVTDRNNDVVQPRSSR